MIDRNKIPSRRTLLKWTALSGATAIAGGFQGCKKTETAAGNDTPKMNAAIAGGTGATEGPEVTKLKFGMIALTDCSPLVIAAVKGHFKKYGIEAVIDKKANWRSIYDSLVSGDIQGTHMLIGTPIASTLGMLGPKVPMVAPWLLNRNGQSISLKKELKGKVQADPKPLKAIVDAAKAGGKPMSFAMTFPPGTHAMWMRYWLGAGGINPDKDVALTVVPPASMFANVQAGNMDGFCVGEPWNAKTVKEGIGFTALNTQDLWHDHPEKVCAFREDFAVKNPRTVKAVLKALQEASAWLDNLDNRPEQCQIVSATNYVNCPKEMILPRMLGKYDFGDGRTKVYDKYYMIFNQRNCNYPQAKYAAWFMSQFRRWGLVDGTPDYAGIAKQVMRGDLYEEAMKELGYTHGGSNSDPETLFDGKVFNPADPEAYAKSFEVNNVKGT